MAPLNKEIAQELMATAKIIATPGKGILAADESTGTIKKRFDGINVDNSEPTRAEYRSLLFSTQGLGQYISGAILYEETLYQKSPEGILMVDLLKAENIIPGIKVDKGLVNIPSTDDEKSTQGLDGLDERCKEYYKAGARFAKWRAVVNIDEVNQKPSNLCINETVHTLARYAAICQKNCLVPIVEPEIMSDGSHSIQVCAAVTQRVLSAQIKALHEHNILLEGCLIKPNMVTCGVDYKEKNTCLEVAHYTTLVIKRCIPSAIAGVFFLSGGQSEEDSTLNLNAINMLGPHANRLSFSFGRALQTSCLKAWAGKTENTGTAQKVLLDRARANSEAALGKYAGWAGGNNAAASNFERKYAY